MAKADFTEFLISFAIIMMMLSFVSERASNFIKIHFQGKKIAIPYLCILTIQSPKNPSKIVKRVTVCWLEADLEILAFKQPTEAMEKEREYRVMIINIIVGIVIATFANANLFEILKEIGTIGKEVNPLKGWQIQAYSWKMLFGFLYMLLFLWSMSLMLFNRLAESSESFAKQIAELVSGDPAKLARRYINYPLILFVIATVMLMLPSFLLGDDKKHQLRFLFKIVIDNKTAEICLSIVLHTFGYIFTGLFLSLGSKFWHDLLDLLFKFKNTKQLLSQPETYTNYDSADKIAALANTSLYEVAEKLYETYRKDIADIDDIASHGLNAILDAKTKLYRKIIEVEFTTAEAQQKLIELQNRASVSINYNNFYLKDYMALKFTSPIEPLTTSISTGIVCYAHNIKSANSMGSFCIFEKENGGMIEYFAKSNLHVFANHNEMPNFKNKPNYKLKDVNVMLKIGTKNFQATIVPNSYKIGTDDEGYGVDYCLCSIDDDRGAEAYKEYYKLISKDKLQDVEGEKMRMFGAVSKYIDFESLREPTYCTVPYNGFRIKLRLYKIKTSLISNVSKGDSGGQIYYKIKTDTETFYNKGILVAKSSNYAYMFLDT